MKIFRNFAYVGDTHIRQLVKLILADAGEVQDPVNRHAPGATCPELTGIRGFTVTVRGDGRRVRSAEHSFQMTQGMFHFSLSGCGQIRQIFVVKQFVERQLATRVGVGVVDVQDLIVLAELLFEEFPPVE